MGMKSGFLKHTSHNTVFVKFFFFFFSLRLSVRVLYFTYGRDKDVLLLLPIRAFLEISYSSIVVES